MNFFHGVINNFLDILFPRCCPVCGGKRSFEQINPLCFRCKGNIVYLRQPMCRVCGLEIHGVSGDKFLCGECLQLLPPYVLARSLVRYGPSVGQLIYKLKYRKDTSVQEGIAEIVSACDLSVFYDCDFIVPVPLHFSRLRKRGLNQAIILARIFFPNWQETLKVDLLIRTKQTISQTGLSGRERRRNLKAVFDVRRGYALKGCRVCLVDDVLTTGTTVKECARVLLQHGAKEVKVLTLARTVMSQRGRGGR